MCVYVYIRTHTYPLPSNQNIYTQGKNLPQYFLGKRFFFLEYIKKIIIEINTFLVPLQKMLSQIERSILGIS